MLGMCEALLATALQCRTSVMPATASDLYTYAESRIGYWWYFNNGRHCGLLASENDNKTSLDTALTRMQEKLRSRFTLPPKVPSSSTPAVALARWLSVCHAEAAP